MKRSRFTAVQIIGLLREQEAGDIGPAANRPQVRAYESRRSVPPGGTTSIVAGPEDAGAIVAMDPTSPLFAWIGRAVRARLRRHPSGSRPG